LLTVAFVERESSAGRNRRVSLSGSVGAIQKVYEVAAEILTVAAVVLGWELGRRYVASTPAAAFGPIGLQGRDG
jgi:hypothetical protein